MAFKALNEHVIKWGKLYFLISLVLLVIGLAIRWVPSPSPSTSTILFTINGDSSVILNIQEVTKQSVEEFVVSGVKRFEKRLEIGSQIHLKWYTLAPGHKVAVDINDGFQKLEQEKGEWTFILEHGKGCFISSLSV